MSMTKRQRKGRREGGSDGRIGVSILIVVVRVVKE